MNAGRSERLAGHLRVGKEAFALQGVRCRRLVETAFEIAKDDLGRPELILYKRERHRRIGDIHQVHVTGEDDLRSHSSPRSRFQTAVGCSAVVSARYSANILLAAIIASRMI